MAAALVVSGLFVGTGLHNVLDNTWTTAILGCIASDPLDIEAQLACQAPAEEARAAVALAAAAVVVILAAAVVMIAPGIIRRKKRLAPADRRYARAVHAVAQLARAEGTRTPGVLVIPPAASEPFCVGRPGDYRIALPRKLALLSNPALFQALVRHELAHLAHHDVALSWLARSLWYVLGPLLALPILVTLLRGDALLALDILWRSGVLIVVVLLIVRALLRAREFDADLRAARVGDVRRVLDVELSRRPEPKQRWRARLAWHPTATSRRAVLAEPASAAAVGWLDGLTIGFLVALALPIATGIASAALLGVRAAGLAPLAGAIVVGPLFGAAIGIGLWRHALVAPAASRGSTPAVALGVLVGGVLGELASLAGVGLGVPAPPIAVPLALAGTTALVGGLGKLWVSGRAWPRGQMAFWLPAAGFGAVAATSLLWAAQGAELLVQEGGWVLLTTWLTTPGTLVLPGVAAVVLAVAGGWASRPRRLAAAPAWLGTGGAADPPLRISVLVGVAAGIGGGLALMGYRLVTGPPGDDADALARFWAVILGAGVVGAIAVALLGLTRGVAAVGAGLLAGPLATVTTGLVYLIFNTALGGNPLALVGPLFGAAVPAGFLLIAPAALIGLLPLPPVRSTAVVAALVLAAGALATGGVTMERAVIVPGLPTMIPGATTNGGGPTFVPPPILQPVITRDLYLPVVARDLLDRRVAETSAFGKLKSDNPPNAEAAAQLRSDILPLARGILGAAQAVQIDDPVVQAVHQRALTAAQAHVDAYELFATALDTNDRTGFDRAQQLLLEGDAQWKAWATAAQTL